MFPRSGKASRRGPFYAPLSVRFSLSTAEEGLERVLRCAYGMTDKAFVMLAGSPRGRLQVRLRPKRKPTRRSLEALAARFEAALLEDAPSRSGVQAERSSSVTTGLETTPGSGEPSSPRS